MNYVHYNKNEYMYITIFELFIGTQKKRYTGPEPPPNRYGITPGYRWDGVNRSNGFEKRFFEMQSGKKAYEEARYRWAVEDM